MINPSSNVLILTGITSLIAFGFRFLRDGVLKEIQFKALVPSLPWIVAVLAAFAAIFFASSFLGLQLANTLAPFLIAASTTMLLSKTGLPGTYRGIILLVTAVLYCMNLSGDAATLSIASAVLGLCVGRIADNTLLGGESTLDDILPPLVWLGGTLAIENAGYGDKQSVVYSSVLLGAIAVIQILQVMQRPFMKDDKWLLKRLILSTSGGLMLLIIITKLVLAMDLTKIALLFGFGLFGLYLFKDIDAEGQDKAAPGSLIKLLIIVGMLTLVATRFWGVFGLALLAPVAIVMPRSGIVQYAAIFFVSRAMLQAFLSTYNANVTGVNVTHPYTGAALYAGLFAMGILLVLLREVTDRRLASLVFLGTGVLLPVVSSYCLHAEPTSSLLISVTVGATVLAMLGPALLKAENVRFDNIILMAPTTVAAGTVFGALTAAGESVTNEAKAIVLAYMTGAFALCMIIGWFVSRQNEKKALPAQSD